jgi:hypothetical protein
MSFGTAKRNSASPDDNHPSKESHWLATVRYGDAIVAVETAMSLSILPLYTLSWIGASWGGETIGIDTV